MRTKWTKPSFMRRMRRATRIFARGQDGVAATELVLLITFILVPLILIMLQFWELLEARHSLIKASRYAAWQRAMGNPPTSADVSNKFGNRSGLGGLSISGSRGSSFGGVPLGGVLGTALGWVNLNTNGRWTYDASGACRLRYFGTPELQYFGLPGLGPLSMRERLVMEADSWKAGGWNDVASVVNRMCIVSALVPQGVDDILQYFGGFRLRNNVDPQLRVP